MNIFNKNNRKYYNEGINRLINQSFEHAWSVENDIDWSKEIITPDGIEIEVYKDMVSQLYYTEEFIINMGAKLIAQIPDIQAKEYITTQLSDESRHALAYHKYIKKFGDLVPINPYLEKIFKFCLSYKGHYSALIIAINVVMESEAVGQQKLRIRTLPCPIFKQMNSYIIKDEARHAAFGTLYMKDKIPLLTDDQIEEIKSFIKIIWKKWDEANENRYRDKGSQILQTTKEELSTRLQDMNKRLKQIGITL